MIAKDPKGFRIGITGSWRRGVGQSIVRALCEWPGCIHRVGFDMHPDSDDALGGNVLSAIPVGWNPWLQPATENLEGKR